MPVVTKYVCDKCGHEQAESGQMWGVVVGVTTQLGGYSGSAWANFVRSRNALWCRKCVESVKMLPSENPKIEAAPEPTLEELLREIVREEIENQ